MWLLRPFFYPMNSHCAPLRVSSGGRLQSVWPVSLWGAEECWLFYDSAVDLWTVGAAGKEARCKSQHLILVWYMQAWKHETSWCFFSKKPCLNMWSNTLKPKRLLLGHGVWPDFLNQDTEVTTLQPQLRLILRPGLWGWWVGWWFL